MNAPLPPRATWTFATTESIKTGTWRAAMPLHVHAPSPCHAACPVGGEIAEWIGHARAGDLRRAWETLTRNNPFPAIAGRICHHPCEAACNRAGYDDALAICKLERHVGDTAVAQGWGFAAPALEREQSVGIVGGGPSGLSAAFQLRRRGYRVTLYEAKDQLGGLMRFGIPPYRLPRATLDAEIERIVALGVDVRRNTSFTSPQALAELRTRHDAVYVAVGAGASKRLPQLDYTQAWAVDSADYLARSSEGAPPALGHRVVVIGGGSAAMDVARSARRRGHAVTLLALEAEAQMPAQRDEVVEALEEGVVLVDGSMMRKASSDGHGVRLDCVKVAFQPGEPGGEFKLEQQSGSDFAIEADAVITAIGQDADLTPFEDLLACHRGCVRVDASGGTSDPQIWAGGDVAGVERFVTEAVGMGKRAALDIHRRLSGEAAVPAFASDEPMVALDSISLFYHPSAARGAERRLPADIRLAGDMEVQLPLDVSRALAESARCFSCGTCINCDNCITYCPDLAVRLAATGYEVLGDYCKGCGVCARECPTGAIRMVEELR